MANGSSTAPRCRWAAGLTVGGVLLAACVGPPPPDYVASVKPIFDQRCATCHNANGIGTMPLTTWAEVEPFVSVIEEVVNNGTMPPWPAGDGCNSYSNDFSLSDDERATLIAWFGRGMPRGEGDEPKNSIPPGDPRGPGIRADVVLTADSAFVPERVDAYRCFAFAWPPEETYITGFEFVPGDPANVHHVNIFLNPPSAREEFLGYEAEDEIAGYSCSNGSSVQFPLLIGSYAPGAVGVPYPEGTGQLAEAGSVVTMQVHYAAPGGSDQSSLVLQTSDSVERRSFGAPFWAFNNWERGHMEIPAGQERVTHSIEIPLGLSVATIAPWFDSDLAEIHLVAIHMHQLGSEARVDVFAPIGDTCLLTIPRWDFHQQMAFHLNKPVEVYIPDDELALSCSWDNSAANQPFVDGVQQPPRDVNWGPGTADEMCIGYVYVSPLPR